MRRPGSAPSWQRRIATPADAARLGSAPPNNAAPGNTPRYATIGICSHEPSARGTSTAR